MAIIQTIDESLFVAAFDRMNRGSNFSIGARRELFAYLDDYSESSGEPFELDVIAICCEFGEYSMEELRDDYGHLVDDADICDPDEREEYDDDLFQALRDEAMIEALREEHTLIEVSGVEPDPDNDRRMRDATSYVVGT